MGFYDRVFFEDYAAGHCEADGFDDEEGDVEGVEEGVEAEEGGGRDIACYDEDGERLEAVGGRKEVFKVLYGYGLLVLV